MSNLKSWFHQGLLLVSNLTLSDVDGATLVDSSDDDASLVDSTKYDDTSFNERSCYLSSWDRNDLDGQVFESCKVNNIGYGILISDQLPLYFDYFDKILFQAKCINNQPVYSSMRLSTLKSTYLPQVSFDWHKFTIKKYASYDDKNQHYLTIFALIFCLTSSFVITVFFAISVFVSLTGTKSRKGLNILKFACAFAVLNMCILIGRILTHFKKQHYEHAMVSSYEILVFLHSDRTYNALDFITTVLFNFCEVLNLEAIFVRSQEKKFVLHFGTMSAVICNIIYGVAKFYPDRDSSSHNVILSPFVYLLRITFATTYSSIIILYGLFERKFSLISFGMSFLTFISFCLVLLQPILFIIDITNVFDVTVGELFNTACYIGSTIVIWEWLDQLSLLKWKAQAQSVLGRPVYEEDEQNYKFANYRLFKRDLKKTPSNNAKTKFNNDIIEMVDFNNKNNLDIEENSLSLSNSISRTLNSKLSNDQESINQIQFESYPTFLDFSKNKLDYIFNSTKKTVKRSTNKLHYTSKKKIEDNIKRSRVKKRIGLDKPDNNDVFVYTTKNIDFSDDDDDDKFHNNILDKHNHSDSDDSALIVEGSSSTNNNNTNNNSNIYYNHFG